MVIHVYRPGGLHQVSKHKHTHTHHLYSKHILMVRTIIWLIRTKQTRTFRVEDIYILFTLLNYCEHFASMLKIYWRSNFTLKDVVPKQLLLIKVHSVLVSGAPAHRHEAAPSGQVFLSPADNGPGQLHFCFPRHRLVKINNNAGSATRDRINKHQQIAGVKS